MAPENAIAKSRGKNPIGYGSETGAQFRNPLISACEIPAMMKSPTPEPIPHLVTTSSMKTIRRPPITTCRKMIPASSAVFPPK